MRDFTVGNEGRLILNFAIPMLIGNVFMQLYQAADTVVVGRFIGKEALAAVGASTPVVFLTIALVIGIGIGASIVISQYFGAKQYDKVRTTCDTLFIFLFVAAVVITLFGVVFSEWILHLMMLPEDIIPLAKQYLQIYFGGIVLLFGYNAIAAIFRGVGDSKTPLYFLIISSVLNIGLDLLFVIRFGWGVAGVAWATVISQGVAFVLSLIYINSIDHVIRVNIFHLTFDRKIFVQCLKMGLPAGAQQVFVGVGMLALMGLVNTYGTDVIAAYSSYNRIETFVSLPVMNFAAALTSFVGQNIGIGNFDRIRRGLKATLIMSLTVCLIVNMVLVFFARPIMSLFTTDANVIEVGYRLLIITNSLYFTFSIMFTINGLLRGAGAAIVPMLTTLLSLWAIRIPAATVLSGAIGYEGIWWAMPIGWGTGMIGAVAYYFSGKWKKKRLVGSSHDPDSQVTQAAETVVEV